VQRSIADASRAASGAYVLFAGRVAAEKGVWDAVEACRAADLPLVVAGDGPELEALRAAGVDARGRLAPEELAALRAGAGAAVVPSRYAEILPLAALEAMAAGLPVVATRSGGLAEAVPEEGLGDLTDGLRRLYRNAEAGERALARARELSSPQRVAERLRAVYAGA
jgi:glycosyltransferase involved in cell wall biosynthesis